MRQSDKLAARLAQIPALIVTEVRPALVQAAGDLAHVAQTLVPVDEGDLRASMAVTAPGDATPAYAEGGGRRLASANQALVTVGNPQVRHGHLVEFGTSSHVNGGEFAGTMHPGTAPRPFLIPSERLTRARNLRRIARAIGKAVRAASLGGAA